MHGFGRLCRVSGQIYEGFFYHGVFHKYGREIDYHTNYIGPWNLGKKLDDSSIEWSSGKNVNYFDQSLLAAKKCMTSNIKANVLGRIAEAKSRGGTRKNKGRQIDQHPDDTQSP